ncbi:DUF1707 domain-containing protein [Corynebacterium halotolerans]|uniref:DUF1707 SHOCT-like domain-containing protein n=1 Tax=Corynebacterium halotolerans TaxID=225326 RepID=UPI003CECCC30
MNDNFRLSDNDRLHALQVLGTHYADGRLDNVEFDERTRTVADARVLGEIRPAFADLPGELPFQQGDAESGGQLVPVSIGTPLSPISPEDRELAEMQDLKSRGKKVESLDGAVLGVTLVAFLILQFVIGVGWAWVVWPSLALTLAIPRLIYRYNDADEKTYEELKEAENEARKQRIRRAAERMRELEDGH